MAVYNGALYSGGKLVSDCDLVKEGGNNITRMYVGNCLIYPSKTYSSPLQYFGSSPTDVCRQTGTSGFSIYWVDCSTLDIGDYVWANLTKTIFVTDGYYGSGNGSSNFYYIINGIVASIGTCPPVYTYQRYAYGWTFGNTNSCFFNNQPTLVYSYVFKPNGFYEILENDGLKKYYLLAIPHLTRTINIDNYQTTGGDCAAINYDPHWIPLVDNNNIIRKTCYNGVLNNISFNDNPFSETYGKYLLNNGVILNTQPIFSVGPCTTATPTPTAATPTPTAVTPTPTPTSTVATPTPTSTQYYLLEKCADTNIQDRSIMNIPNLGDGTVVKLNDGQCYTIIGRSTLETTNTITDYNYSNNCNLCRGITPPTPTPITQYYDLYRCDNSGGDRSVINVSGLANGTVVKLNDGQCYTITGTSTDYTTNTINSTHYNCNECRGIVPPTPTPTNTCGEWQFVKYYCEDCIIRQIEKLQFCDNYRVVPVPDKNESCPQPILNINVCYDGYDNGNSLFTVNVTKSNQIEPFNSEYFELYYWDNGVITRINDANGFVSDNITTPVYLSNPLFMDIIAFMYPYCNTIIASNIVSISYDNPPC
jgi:hypothetical protein